MNEPHIKKLIQSGEPVEINGVIYDIEKQPQGHCDGCAFTPRLSVEGKEKYGPCPTLAMHICCTGGNILKEHEEK